MVNKASILRKQTLILNIIVKTDLFDDVTNRVFLKLAILKLSYHVLIFSENFYSIKYNYAIYNKEL